MRKTELFKTWKAAAALLLILSVSLALFSGCESKKLVDQNDRQMGEIVESIQSSFAEGGWTYSGYELVETNAEMDTATVALAYDVVGDAADILKAHTSEQPKDDSIYNLAENINVKAIVELSAYDKDNDALGCRLLSTEWFVGDTEANEWIREQNGS